MKAHRRDFIKAASVLAGTGAVEHFVSARGTAPVEAVEQPTDRLGDIEAFAFDAYGTLFDVFSVTALCEDLFPGAGQELAQLWRAKQLQYSLLRSLMGRHKDFWSVLLQGLGSRARIRWVDLVTRPIRTPCGSAASARPRRPSPSIAPVPCGAHA